MSDRICPCGMSFPYPSQLKRHQNSKLGCIPYMQYVQSHNTPFTLEPARERGETSVSNAKEFLCIFCNKEFSTKFNQERHQKTCKANQQEHSQNLDISNIIDKIMNNKNTNNKDLIFKIDKNGNTQICICKSNDLIQNNLQPISTKPISTRPILNRNINIPEIEIDDNNNVIIPVNTTSNTNNNSNTNNGNIATSNASITNITTNITNNYNDTTPGVYPFGSENINFLTEAETLEILKSPNGANLVLQKIYSHIDNNNFMRMNKKDKTLEYIESHNTIISCDTKEFITKMYEQSKNLLQRIFFHCYKKLSEENKLVVWNNIQRISTILDTKSKSLESSFNNIITANCNNSFKKAHFKGIKTNIDHNNPAVMNKMKALYDKIRIEKNNIINDLATKTISIDDIKKKIWEPEKDNPDMDLDNYRNDLYCNHLETTPRFLLLTYLNKLEYQYLLSKNLTMGDIEMYYNYKQSRINEEISTLKDKFSDMPDSYIQDINNLFITKPNDDNDNALKDVHLENSISISIP